jgi:hypothetical protein
MAGKTDVRIYHTTDMRIPTVHRELVLRDHRRCTLTLSPFRSRDPFLPYSLELLLITSFTSLPSPSCSLLALLDLLPTLYSDLVERLHLSFATSFFFCLVLRSFYNDIDSITFAFAGEYAFVLANRAGVGRESHDGANAGMAGREFGGLLCSWLIGGRSFEGLTTGSVMMGGE